MKTIPQQLYLILEDYGSHLGIHVHNGHPMYFSLEDAQDAFKSIVAKGITTKERLRIVLYIAFVPSKQEVN